MAASTSQLEDTTREIIEGTSILNIDDTSILNIDDVMTSQLEDTIEKLKKVVRSLEEINRNSTMASLTYKLYRFILEKEDEAAAELNAVDTDSIETKLVKLENKQEYILEVEDNPIDIRSLYRPKLVKLLKERGFTPFPSEDKPLSDYDYLEVASHMELPIQKYEELCAQKNVLQDVVSILKRIIDAYQH
ncbi:hypothetical protein ISN44_As05g048860 [Arabidopsis suecica]|uniref:Uncharacterized protein n=1 Tax=Arabidopsis suecica TaxID=45249 RepID=A0A8T2DRM0_ARASU|nr:hypothetical protein ISN44_As05g048860 [Arabidopsis suecica]